MPRKHYWTPAEDAALHVRRANRQSWEEIATALGLSRSATRDRGRAIGARRPPSPSRDTETDPLDDPNREPLPPGHLISWTVLTEGTLLAGTHYPWPPFPAGSDTTQSA